MASNEIDNLKKSEAVYSDGNEQEYAEEADPMLPSKVDIESNSKVMAEKKKTWKQMTWKEKRSYIWDNITIEPILACYIMPSVLASLATQNLYLEKACRVNMGYSDQICDALTRRETANYTHEEKTVQQLVAGMASWKTILQSTLPCMLILFWGSWSDRHGRRKPCMLIPIIGEFITALGLILCTYFENVPMEVAGVTEALFPGLTGGWFTMMLGIFSYIGDVTSEEERTLRIGIVNLCFSLGVPIGMAFSGLLLKKIGFYGVFSISATLYLVAFTYGVFRVKEPVNKTEKEKNELKKKSILADFFDKEHVVETFRVAFKTGSNKRRLRVMLLIIVVMVVIGPLHGEMVVFYLFTRFRFNWSEVEFSFFSTYAMLTGLIGTSFSVGVFSHVLKIDDALIGVISCTSKILSSFVYAFAVTDWQIYLGPIAEILSGTSFIAMRSIASKLVDSHELGKVNSLFGVAEALMPLVYAPMYATVYSATLNTLPGAFFLLGGLLTTPAVLIFLWMYRINKKDDNTIADQESKNNGEDMVGKISVISEKRLDWVSENGNTNTATASIPSISQSTPNLSSRMGSFRKRDVSVMASRKRSDGVLQEAIELVKDLPALHVEHCKL